MSTLKVSTISPLGTDATKTITIGSAGDTIAGMGANTPAFSAANSTSQTISLNTDTKVTFDSEAWDTNNAFADSKFTVPTGGGGKYAIYIDGAFQVSADYKQVWIKLHKNGSYSDSVPGIEQRIRMTTNYFKGDSSQRLSASGTILLAEGDYLEVFGYINADSGTPQFNGPSFHFSGNRLIGA